MTRVILALIAFGMALAIFKLIILALVIAGLIFRTKETVAVLIVAGLFSLIRAYPVPGLILLAIIGICAIVMAVKKEPAGETLSLPPPSSGADRE